VHLDVSFALDDPNAEPQRTQGYRGETVGVRGILVDDKGVGIANATINLFLAPAGADGNGSKRVGRTATDAFGEFEADIEVPVSFELAAYELFASYGGSSQYRAVLSE
jgi:hypothetical protein